MRRWPLVLRSTMTDEVNRARRDTRRNLINHLRRNPRGVILLDNVQIGPNVTMPAPITVLGDSAMIIDCTLKGEVRR